MAEPTPADEISQAVEALQDGSNSIDALLRARKPLARWLGSWKGYDVPADSPHVEDYRCALWIAQAINGSDRG